MVSLFSIHGIMLTVVDIGIIIHTSIFLQSTNEV